MRRLLRRSVAEEAEEFSRPSEFLCSSCSGEMRFKMTGCMDPEHGDACTRMHFGYECVYCGRVVDEAEAGEPDINRTVSAQPSGQATGRQLVSGMGGVE